MKVYLVKFNCGYYAKKQPHYDWSYTDDPLLANRYKTYKAAKERADWGIRLWVQWDKFQRKTFPNAMYPSTAVIEEYEVVETLSLTATHS